MAIRSKSGERFLTCITIKLLSELAVYFEIAVSVFFVVRGPPLLYYKPFVVVI